MEEKIKNDTPENSMDTTPTPKNSTDKPLTKVFKGISHLRNARNNFLSHFVYQSYPPFVRAEQRVQRTLWLGLILIIGGFLFRLNSIFHLGLAISTIWIFYLLFISYREGQLIKAMRATAKYFNITPLELRLSFFKPYNQQENHVHFAFTLFPEHSLIGNIVRGITWRINKKAPDYERSIANIRTIINYHLHNSHELPGTKYSFYITLPLTHENKIQDEYDYFTNNGLKLIPLTNGEQLALNYPPSPFAYLTKHSLRELGSINYWQLYKIKIDE